MAQRVPRTSYNHIVLLTDLTSRSDSALSYARAFAQYYGSRLTLLHILQHPVLPGVHDSPGRNAEKARRELEAIAAELKTAGIDAHVHLNETARSADEILGCLARVNPDLIVQGTAGVASPRRALVGSFAEGIFRRSKTPVLTVGAQVMPFMEKDLRFNRIMFVTNFGSQVTNTAIYALSLAQEFRAHITLCHVHSGETAPWNKEDIRQYFERALQQRIAPEVKDWCDPECLVLFGNIDAEIQRLMEQQRPDLIITAAHALGPLGTRGKPGTAFRIVADAQCPVLTILGAPVKAEHPVYPDNYPEMIALC